MAVALGATALAVFLMLQGLDRADRWASVLALFVAILMAAVSGRQALLAKDARELDALQDTLGIEALRPRQPRRVGPFRLLGFIGAGSMGQVYLGRNGAGALAAVKVMNSDLVADPEFRERFRRELRDVRRVRGDHFLAVIDADPEAELPWVATEYFPGLRLDDMLKVSGPWPLPAVAWLGYHLARALRQIHAADIVHRDLKPANVLVDESGVRVIDFGIARSGADTRLTMTGAVIGTVAYMSPEQAEGTQAVTASADVFALGSLLVFAATGSAPFGTEPWHMVLRRIISGAPDLDALGTEETTFRPLRQLVERCLDKAPQRRPTLDEIVAACEPLAAAMPASWFPDEVRARTARRRGVLPAATADAPARHTRRRRRYVPVVAVATAVAVLAGAGVAFEDRILGDVPAVAVSPSADPPPRGGLEKRTFPAAAAFLRGDVPIGIADDLPGWGGLDGDRATGFDVAFAQFLAERLGFTPGWVELLPGQRIPALKSGKVKLVLAAFSRTDERAREVGFAGPYFRDRSGLLCSPTKFDCTKPVPRHRVCVYGNTTMQRELPDVPARDSIRECLAEYYRPQSQIVAVATDETILRALGVELTNVSTAVWTTSPEDPITTELYGIGFPKGRAGLCEDLTALADEFLRERWNAAFEANLAKSQSADGRKPSAADRTWCRAA